MEVASLEPKPLQAKDVGTEQPPLSETKEEENERKEKEEEEHSSFFRENFHHCGVIPLIQCHVQLY